MEIGRKFYYDTVSPNVILTTSEYARHVATTVKQDYQVFEELS